MNMNDTVGSLRGEFTLTEIIDGKSTVLFTENNLIVNNAKESMGEILAGDDLAEEGGVAFPAIISRFEIGTGAHSGTTVDQSPVATMNELYAKIERDGGDTTQEIYRVDYMPNGAGVVSAGAIHEYDSDIIWGAGANYSTQIDTSTGPSTVELTYIEPSGYIEGIEYTITIPEVRANQNGSTSAPIYYSEAGLFVRKGDLDTTSGEAATNTDMFAMKTFPPKPKDSNSKWVVSWKITW